MHDTFSANIAAALSDRLEEVRKTEVEENHEDYDDFLTKLSTKVAALKVDGFVKLAEAPLHSARVRRLMRDHTYDQSGVSKLVFDEDKKRKKNKSYAVPAILTALMGGGAAAHLFGNKILSPLDDMRAGYMKDFPLLYNDPKEYADSGYIADEYTRAGTEGLKVKLFGKMSIMDIIDKLKKTIMNVQPNNVADRIHNDPAMDKKIISGDSRYQRLMAQVLAEKTTGELQRFPNLFKDPAPDNVGRIEKSPNVLATIAGDKTPGWLLRSVPGAESIVGNMGEPVGIKDRIPSFIPGVVKSILGSSGNDAVRDSIAAKIVDKDVLDLAPDGKSPWHKLMMVNKATPVTEFLHHHPAYAEGPVAADIHHNRQYENHLLNRLPDYGYQNTTPETMVRKFQDYRTIEDNMAEYAGKRYGGKGIDELNYGQQFDVHKNIHGYLAGKAEGGDSRFSNAADTIQKGREESSRGAMGGAQFYASPAKLTNKILVEMPKAVGHVAAIGAGALGSVFIADRLAEYIQNRKIQTLLTEGKITRQEASKLVDKKHLRSNETQELVKGVVGGGLVGAGAGAYYGSARDKDPGKTALIGALLGAAGSGAANYWRSRKDNELSKLL